MKSLYFKKNHNLVPWLGGLVLVGISAIATVNYLEKSNIAADSIASQTIAVKTQDLAVQIQANGTVRAVRTTNLSPEEPGKIAELYIEEGDRVTAGQIIARMESDRLQAQVDRYKAALQKARANLALFKAGNRSEAIAAAQARVTTAEANVAMAQAKLERTKEEKQRNQMLVSEGAISHDSFDNFANKEVEAQANLQAELARLVEQQENFAEASQGSRDEEIAQAEAEVAQAQAELDGMQIQLDKKTVRAPFNGIITRRYAEAGDYVDSTTAASETEGATSTSIGELSSGLEIEAKIPEANIAQIKLGQPVDIKVDAYGNETFKGEVSLIAPRAIKENNVTSFRVKVALKTGQEQLKSGMNTRLTFNDEPVKNAITIPLAAVVTNSDGETGVYVSGNEGKAEFKTIKLGKASGNSVQILSGLSKGDRIFTSPPDNVTIEGVDTVTFD